jgi:outer membrane receptor protein involved in Fe transport
MQARVILLASVFGGLGGVLVPTHAYALQDAAATGGGQEQAVPSAATPAAPNAPAPQDSAATPDKPTAADTSDIVVTGSRLGKSGFTAPTPTTVISAEMIQSRGLTNIGDALNEYPAFRTSQNAQTAPQSSSQSGQVYADLRGLGSIRTLVLVDGRRHVPTAPTGQVDTNLIPSGLVERVDVVTGGASAAYGSDAVSGVVNIILNTKFNGIRGDVSTGISAYGDDNERRISLAGGGEFADGKGHFVVGGDYVQSDGVSSYLDRPWGRRGDDIVSFPTNRPAGTPSRMFASGATYTGSPAGGLIIGPNADTNPANGADVLRGIGFAPNGSAYAFNYGNDPGTGTAYNNTAPDGSFTRLGHELILPVKRYVALAHLDYDVSKNLSFWMEGSYARSGSDYNGPTQRDTSATGIVIQQDSAFLPQSVRDIMVANNIKSFGLARANVDYDQTQVSNYNTTEQFAAGLKGSLGGSWHWDGYYQYGRNVYSQIIGNLRIKNNFNYAVDAVRSPTGQIVCRALLPGSSTYNPTVAAGCVPLDLFGDGAPSQAASTYVHGRSIYQITQTEEDAAFNLRGNLFNTWAGAVAVAVGGEYRADNTDAISDALSQSAGFLFGNPKAFSGSLNTKEAYAEALVPLAKDLPFARSLDLNGAVRYTDYSASGGVTTWKVGATWEPFDGIKFRGTRSRDIRAPNSSELFQTTNTNATLRNSFSGQTLQINVFNEPSPSLQPEKADTTTAGIVLTPAFLPGLNISVDYYDIDIKGAISSYAPQFLIDSCASGAGNSAFFCSFLNTSGSGASTTINSVSVQLLNIASVKTNGVDFDVSYRRPLGSGTVTARVFGNYVAHLISDDGLGNKPTFDSNGVIQSLGSVIDRAGQVGGFFSGNNNGATSSPHWQLNGSVSYATSLFSATVQGRYVGGGKVDKTLVDPSSPYYNAASPISVLNNDVSGRFYVNLSGTVHVINDGKNKVDFYLVANNVTNASVPFPATQLAGLYDRTGTYFTGGIRFGF